MKNIIYLSFLFFISSCSQNHEKASYINSQAETNMKEHDLGKEIQDFIEKLELENEGKLEYYASPKFVKKNGEQVLTSEIYGQNNITIRTGIVGISVNYQEEFFGVETERVNFIQSYESKTLALGYKELILIDQSLLFIQIQLSNNKNGDNLFKESDYYLSIMDSLIYEKHLGSFTASDFGAGYNLLYHIWDIDIALPHILKLLEENDLDKKTVIAKRIYKSEVNWDYEVIQPKGYTGKFDSY